MIEVELMHSDLRYRLSGDDALVSAAARTLERYGGGDSLAMTIVLTSDEEVAKLNHQFRGVDAPTDVLSFPAETLPDEIDDDENYVGDVVIAYPYALAQAIRLQHDPLESFSLLVVHGTLHLLGYDHDSADSKAAMWAAQAEVLTSLGIPLEIVPALEENNHDDTAS
jgi:probable rRNA maturation factor